MSALATKEMRAIKERPVLFSDEMVRAILESRKTQTRRVANVRGADRVIYVTGGKLVPSRAGDEGFTGWVAEVDKLGGANGLHLPLKCPHGQPGDRLWVRESFAELIEHSDTGSHNSVIYRADYAAHDGYDAQRWTPSIHMPRWASRITLEITKVRVERVQEISEADANAEGCLLPSRDQDWTQCRRWYQELWDKINAKRGFGWDKNPWVWVIEFKVL